MNERQLRHRLASTSPPDEAGAERRAWTVVRAAFAEREPAGRRWDLRPALVLAALAALVAAALSPPGRAVFGEMRDAIGRERVEPAREALASLPAAGRLLVSSPAGTWVVRRDGGKRRLGAYREAAWSPSGLFVVAVRGHQLVALDPALGPDRNVRWSLTRSVPPAEPRWTGTRRDTRIAYLAGRRLRVVAGDGEGDRLLDEAVVPGSLAWRPGSRRYLLAYVKRPGMLLLRDADTRRIAWRARIDGPARLAWSADGRRLLAATPRGLVLFGGDGRRLRARRLRGVVTLTPAPAGRRFALVRRGRQDSSDVAVVRAPSLAVEEVVTLTGQVTSVAWSPDGRWLLVAWPSANQWLFVPLAGGRPRPFSEIAAQFAPGTLPAGFPDVAPEGWCCAP